jgi:hypothetical protein
MALPQLHQAAIHDNAGNPGLEARFAAKTIEASESRAISILHGILGILSGAKNSKRDPEGRLIVLSEKLFDSVTSKR